MTRPDRPSSGRTTPYSPLLLVVGGLVVLGAVTNRLLFWTLVAAGIAALYGGYHAVRSRQ